MLRHEKVIVIDVDGTLTKSKKSDESYADVFVEPAIRARLVELKSDGYWIILATSRNMRTFDGNIGQIMKHTAPVLIEWLSRHEIPYDELHFGKAWCGNDGFYVDDRAIRPREFAELSLADIETVLAKDRL